MDYKAKYLKYKAKYLKNKLIGGANLNMQPNAIYKEVIFGLTVLQTKEGEYLPSKTNLYYKLNNEYVLVGTLDDIRKINIPGSRYFLIKINKEYKKFTMGEENGIREYTGNISENTPEVKLYYNENEPPVKPPVKLAINPLELITDPNVRDRIFPNVLPEGIPKPGDFSFMRREEDMDSLTKNFAAISEIQGGFESLIPKSGETIHVVPPSDSTRKKVLNAILITIPDAILVEISKHLYSSRRSQLRNQISDQIRSHIMSEMQAIATFGWIQYVQLVRNREGTPIPVPEIGREIETKTETNVNFSTEQEFCPICFDRLDSFDRSEFLGKTETKIKHTICKVSESVECGHIFHCECIKNWTSDRRDCPVCRKEIRKLEELNYSNNKLIGGALSYINSRGYRVTQVPVEYKKNVYTSISVKQDTCTFCNKKLSDGRLNCVVSDGTKSGEINKPVTCGHVFHLECIQNKHIDQDMKRECPECDGPINNLYFCRHNEIIFKSV